MLEGSILAVGMVSGMIPGDRAAEKQAPQDASRGETGRGELSSSRDLTSHTVTELTVT